MSICTPPLSLIPPPKAPPAVGVIWTDSSVLFPECVRGRKHSGNVQNLFCPLTARSSLHIQPTVPSHQWQECAPSAGIYSGRAERARSRVGFCLSLRLSVCLPASLLLRCPNARVVFLALIPRVGDVKFHHSAEGELCHPKVRQV